MRTIAALAAASLLGAPSHAGELPALTRTVVVSGLTQPVAMAEHPDLDGVLIVAQQGGLVRVVQDGAILPAPFLDLTGQILGGGERGLLGLTFDPDYANTRRFFVNFTNPDGHTVIARFRTSESNPLQADPASRFDLVFGGQPFIPQPASFHNGGNILFGPDGMLYIGMGDGGPPTNGQNVANLLGKMLRIDVAVPDSDPEGLDIPADNPFLDSVPIAAPGEVIAFGLRNPWRWSFDDFGFGATGWMLIGDVGQFSFEEIDLLTDPTQPRNFGWPRFEASSTFNGTVQLAFQPHTPPIHEYPRVEGVAVTGGYVLRGSRYCAHAGRYLFADFGSGRYWSFLLTPQGAAADLRIHSAEIGGVGLVSSFARDRTGSVYIISHGGSISRIDSTEPPLPGDSNFDGVVNFTDLNDLLDGYTPDQFPDLNDLLGAFNQTCP